MATSYGANVRAKEYSLEEKCAFTNHGSYGFVPNAVETERQRLVAMMNANPDRFFRAFKSRTWLENLEAVCRYLGLPFELSVFVDNTTTGINDILNSFPFQSGDCILTTNLIYGAMHYVSESVAAKKDLQVVDFAVRFPIASKKELIENFDSTLAAYGGRIRLAIIEAIASYSAAQLPVKELIAVARRHKVTVVVDGAHTCGQLTNAEVQELYNLSDFFVASLHKWMFTARPVGLLSVKPEQLALLRPAITSWGFASRHTDFHTLFLALGTKDYTPFFTLKTAIQFRERMDAIADGGLQRYNTELVDQAANRLAEQIGTNRLRYCTDEVDNQAFHCPFMREIELPQAIQSWLKTGIPAHDYRGIARKESTDGSKDDGSADRNYWLPGTSGLLNQRMSKLMTLLYERYRVVATIVEIDTVRNCPTVCVRISAQVYSTAEDFERLGEALLDIVRLVEANELPISG